MPDSQTFFGVRDVTSIPPDQTLPAGYYVVPIPPSGDTTFLENLDTVGVTGTFIAVTTGPFTIPNDPAPPSNIGYWPGTAIEGQGYTVTIVIPGYNTETIHVSIYYPGATLPDGRPLYGDTQAYQNTSGADLILDGSIDIPVNMSWTPLATSVPIQPPSEPYAAIFSWKPFNVHDATTYNQISNISLLFQVFYQTYSGVNGVATNQAQLYFVYKRLSGSTGTPPPPPPAQAATAVDLLNTRTGLYFAVPQSAMIVRKYKTAFGVYVGQFTADSDSSSAYPTLAYQTEGEGVIVFYRKGGGTSTSPYGYYARTTYDGGATWAQRETPPGGSGSGKETAMLTGIKWARIATLGDGKKARGEAVIYNDGSGKDSSGNANGTGLMFCDLYDATGAKVGTFPTDKKGIAAATADDAGFGLEYVNDKTHDLRVVFLSGGKLVYAVSVDDGRTWTNISSQLP